MQPSRSSALGAVTIAVALLVSAPMAAAAEPAMDVMIGSAKTKADHEKLAAEFDKKAGEARAESAKHKQMAEAYRKSGSPAIVAKSGLVEHCEILAKAYADAAERFAALAKAEREMAAEVK